MNKNQVKGRLNVAKGKSKEIAGKAVGSKRLQREGTLQKVGGKAEAAYGDLKRKVRQNTK